MRLYEPAFLSSRGAQESVDAFAESAGLGQEYTAKTGAKWSKQVLQVEEKWLNEVMGGSVRANYATDIEEIHALGAGVSLASDSASAVAGGNWQIFKGMLDASGATVHLDTEVKNIIPSYKSGKSPTFKVVSSQPELNYIDYDAAFFAAPWHFSPISKKIEKKFKKPIPAQPYVLLHVTYMTTGRVQPDAAFFGLSANTTMPNTILTVAKQSPRGETAQFVSLQWLGETKAGSGEYVVKIFSLARFSDSYLRGLLGQKPTWVSRKEWDSYPKLTPVTSYAPVEPIKGFHYLAAQEAWVSTMDTQTISGREAVARTARDWWSLGLGDCEDGDSWDWTC